MNKDENEQRFIFRPTEEQVTRIEEMLKTGKYKHRSELIRRALNIGLDELEK